MDLRVLETNCIFLKVWEITGLCDFLVQILGRHLFQLNSFVFVITDLVNAKNIVFPEKAFCFIDPTSMPVLRD